VIPASSEARAHLGVLTAACVHCGFCLAACPTYAVTREENDSPRGRILLLAEQVAHGGPIDPMVRRHVDRCIGCEACVPACPSGVRYDQIIHRARGLVEEGRPLAERAWRRSLARAFPSALLSAAVLRLARPFVGLRSVLARLGVPGRRLARSLAQAAVVDDASPSGPPAAPRSPRGRVALLAGCVAASALAETNRDALRVLAEEGFEVELLEGVCCGALSDHAGEPVRAAHHAAALANAFERLGGDAPLLVTSAGCGAELRRYREVLGGPGGDRVAQATQDITEFLARIEPRAPRGPVPLRVAVHDACHLRFAQGVVDAPRAVLRQIPKLELLEVGGPNCCGAGGLYSLFEPELASEVGGAKRDAILALDPEVVASPNPGCTLQLRTLLGEGIEVVHPVSLLARSLESAGVCW